MYFPSALIAAPSYTDTEQFPVEFRQNYDAIMESILCCTGDELINALKRITNYPEFLFSDELIDTIRRVVNQLDDQTEVVQCHRIIKLSEELNSLMINLKLQEKTLLQLLQSFLYKDELDEDQRTIDNFIIAMKNYVI
ncbi:MAG: hypothetical protein ABIM99_06595 [Candidatus Dojkabacteria bacterium]